MKLEGFLDCLITISRSHSGGSRGKKMFFKKKLYPLLITAILLGAGVYFAGADDTDKPLMTMREAVDLAKNGKTNEAVREINRILASKPESVNLQGRLSLGMVYFKAKLLDNALGEFNKSIAIRMDNPMAYYFMGMIYEQKASALPNGQSADYKKKALTAWMNYLDSAGKTTMSHSEAHKYIGISREECMERARKHIEVLQRELENAGK